MNPAQQPSASAQPLINTSQQARQLTESLIEIMSALLKTVEQETELVRAGKIHDSIRLESTKSDLSRRYVSTIATLRANKSYMSQATPDLLATLHRHHETFRAILQVNLTVLATAHAVSEGIVRGVNREMQKRAVPSTYTASGNRNTQGTRHAAPLTLSRSL